MLVALYIVPEEAPHWQKALRPNPVRRLALLHDGLRTTDLPRVAAVPSPDRPRLGVSGLMLECGPGFPMWMQQDVLQKDVLQSNGSRIMWRQVPELTQQMFDAKNMLLGSTLPSRCLAASSP